MTPYTPPKAASFVPLIDLAGSYSADPAQRRAVAWEIHKASRDTGFFYVKNHSVSAEVCAAHLELAREFFALPQDAKREVDVARSSCKRGYEASAIQILDEGSPPDLKEGFLVGADLGPTHPLVEQRIPFAGANQWPQRPEHFREHFQRYVEQMLVLGSHLMGCIALSLDLPADYFSEALTEPFYFSRLLHYPPHPARSLANQLGAGAHKDWGMLTMLLQDDVGGLEVQNADGEWIKAPYMPGTFVINLGEMMPILTNGLYHSTLHRVMNDQSGRDRYSAPTFFDPDYFYEVKCVPTCKPAPGEPELAPRTVGEHIAAMIRKTYNVAT
jgi:isopenicillin N synthase-like dioxygenase